MRKCHNLAPFWSHKILCHRNVRLRSEFITVRNSRENLALAVNSRFRLMAAADRADRAAPKIVPLSGIRFQMPLLSAGNAALAAQGQPNSRDNLALAVYS